ncbi:MAG: DUF1643 domain-containing protein [Dehalococcoidia bacterium]
MNGGATFDATRAYRYHLWREWDPGLPAVTFVMLNPSTAGAARDDPTIRRCLGFARSWGYGGLKVVNLFAFRATSPRELFAAADPLGPENSRWLDQATARRGHLLLAWGNHGTRAPGETVRELTNARASCLGLTRLGQPLHPLYVPAGRRPVPHRSLRG